MDDEETKEFQQGYSSYKRGEWHFSNPYSDDTKEFDDYDEGWLQAKNTDRGEE